MKSRGIRSSPLFALAMLILIGVASPTSGVAAKAEAKAEAQCPRNSLCVWAKTNFRGDRLVIDEPGTSNKIFRKMNDRVSSARLRHPGYAVLYEHINQEGNQLCLLDAPGVRKYPDLDAMNYGNSISSSALSDEPIDTCF